MASLSVNRAAILTWAFLVGASVATWLLIENRGLDAAAAVASIMLIALVKARLIVLHFMELKHAPLRWRIAFELWVVVAASLILGLWWFTGSGADCGLR
ncbi:cytochrome C oxidase subunit IV family protein [Panacagrimonas sp.]|uniref:cytochrome C oxidase subunit IV family protein n=1 Tax=Panacagrimonas sp. TaxID=2480088 RepID=UPI003B521A41